MAVISISITESSEQIVSGIPKFVNISTNIPSTIFYTIDGSTPTLFSNIYTEAIFLPIDKPTATLKVFASNRCRYITYTYRGLFNKYSK